jgi:hypothetical protein
MKEMNKEQIDNYFTKNTKQIKSYIENRFFSRNIFNEQVDYFFTELYLFILERKDLIDNEKTLQNFISNFIYMNTQWKNSQYRELGSIQKTSKKQEFVNELHDFLFDESDVEEKIFDEINLYEYNAINELYYQSLTSLEKKVIWEIYFIEKQNSIRKFAKYIGRSRSVADRYIKELKSDLNKFYNDLKTKEEKNNNI